MKNLKTYEQAMDEIVHDARSAVLNRKPATVPTPECPACSHARGTVVRGQVYNCGQCGAIHGSCYLGDSYLYVQPFMQSAEPPAEFLRYFDFTCLGSKGVTRRHGWYDTRTRNIVQVG